MRSLMLITGLMLAAAPAAAFAQVAVCKDPRGCNVSGASPGAAAATPGPDTTRQEARRRRATEWSQDEGLDYLKRKDWNNAIRSFEEALEKDPDNQEIAGLLTRARSEKARAAAVAVIAPSPAPQADARVVASGSGPSGLPKAWDDAIAGAYRDAPPGVIERVRKGYQAVMVADWKVAGAWFGDALIRDPGNVGLKRLIAAVAADRPPPKRPVGTLQLPSDEDMLLLFPGVVPMATGSLAPGAPGGDTTLAFRGYNRVSCPAGETSRTCYEPVWTKK